RRGSAARTAACREIRLLGVDVQGPAWTSTSVGRSLVGACPPPRLRGMTPHTIGINLWGQASPSENFLAPPTRVAELGTASLWAWDHLHAIIGDPQQAIFEGYVTLGAWAQATTNVKLGLMVGANTFRNPGLVVKSITTLDHASGGRAILGIGGAWFEYEHTAHGIDFGRGLRHRLHGVR